MILYGVERDERDHDRSRGFVFLIFRVGAVVQDLPAVRALLQPYSNVRVSIEKPRHDDGYLDCVISVDAFLGGGTLRYEVRSNGKKKKYYEPLAWIDEIEKWDALFF